LVREEARHGEEVTNEFVAKVNAMPGWVREMGIVILAATPEEVSCEWQVSEKHHQGYGIVHGGVHCGVIETLASVGAAAVAHPRGQRVLHSRRALGEAARPGQARHARPLEPGMGGVDTR
jgi:1,4-dihydroxy-2-naphthoyl-CoA hydrolase